MTEREKKLRRLNALGLLLCSSGALCPVLMHRYAWPDWALRCVGVGLMAGIALVSFTTVSLWRQRNGRD